VSGEKPTITLSHSGYQAVIETDRWVPGSFTLVVDGTPQSHVNMDDPSELFFEYIQRMGHVIDQIGMPGQPITAVHLGAGAFTLPRYIEATRPGSRQQVVEIESDLVDFVRTYLPWSPRAQIKVRHGDARAVLAKFPAGLRGSVDLLVVDIFSGARTPAHVTSLEFYTEAVSLLSDDGIVLVRASHSRKPRHPLSRRSWPTSPCWPRPRFSRAAASATSFWSARVRRCRSSGCRAFSPADRTRPRWWPAPSCATSSRARRS
jgi:spermidine synthase